MRRLTNIYLLATLFVFACSTKEQTFLPEVKSLTEAVYASGNIFPKEQYLVFANVDGIINKSLIEPGDVVEKGQALFFIDNDIQQAKYSSASEIYKTAMDNFSSSSPALTEAKAQVESAKIKLQNDSLNFVRLKNLIEANAVSKVEYDKASLAYKVSANDYLARKSNLERIRKQLYVELQQAQSQYKVNDKEQQNTFPKAILTGTVYEVYKEEGEAVRRNEAIALLGNDKQLILKLSVDETDISKVQLGQEVLVKTDLNREKIYSAKVTKIYPKLNIQDKTFKVEAEFIGDKPAALHGLTVEANIIVNQKENVLTIPKKFLASADSVWILKDNEAQKIKIKKGIEDFDFVEIVSGLDKNTQVIKK